MFWHLVKSMNDKCPFDHQREPKFQSAISFLEYFFTWELSHQCCPLGGKTVQQAEANHSGHLHQALHVPALQVDCEVLTFERLACASVNTVNLQVSCVHPLKRHLPQRHQAPGNLVRAWEAKIHDNFSPRIFCLILSLESSSCAISAVPSIWSGANPMFRTSALDTTGLQLESLLYLVQLLFKLLQGTWTDFWSDRLHNEHRCVECWLRFCWADVGPGWCERMRSKSMDVITRFASKLFSRNCFSADFPWW